jgi:hypothetical protein
MAVCVALRYCWSWEGKAGVNFCLSSHPAIQWIRDSLSVKWKRKVVPANAIEAYRTRGGMAPLVLNLRSVWSASRPCRFIFREMAHVTHSLGGWVWPGVNLDSVEKAMYVAHAENRTAIPRSSSQYSCPYSGHSVSIILHWNDALRNLSETIFSSDFYGTGTGSSVGLATPYGLDGQGIESRWGREFPQSPDRPWVPPNPYTVGIGSFPGVKWLRPDVDHPKYCRGYRKSRVRPLLPPLILHGRLLGEFYLFPFS